MPIHRRAFLAVALTATLAACAGRPEPPPAAARPSVEIRPSSTPPAAAPSLSTTDSAWIEISIAMDEQLLPLLDLAASRAARPALRELAAQVRTRTQKELAALRRLHDAAGLPAENPHKGMPMPGMVTPEQVAEAAAATGAAFDTLVRTHLEAHLTQCVHLIGSLLKTGSAPQVVTVADTMKANAEYALEKMGTRHSGSP
ncbi:DUF305 domain-containing protein [Actinoplanes sp. NPDC023936]|uniref:DUF305 domain-containing protein n=1 Tax=Actinoplanes sp. NPDC023936 TaxID=3154910 RepID=UPI0033FC913F